MKWKFWKHCEHTYIFVRNLYGDQINQHHGMRSEWKCTKCGHIQYREDLHNITDKLCDELDKLCEKHYKNLYKNWCEEHSETLNKITKECRERAYQGYCYLDIVLIIDEETNDKNYYERWFSENGLKFDYNIDEHPLGLDKYVYHLRWYYK